MVNYGSKILGSAVNSISAQHALLANVGSNIANVSTPGYARRILDLEDRGARSVNGSFAVGNGVQIGTLRRATDEFLDRLVLDARGDFQAKDVTSDYLQKLESLFPIDGSAFPIGEALDDFFGTVTELNLNPGSIELRKNLLVAANQLSDSISGTFNAIAELQLQADQEIQLELEEANTLMNSIAQLNGEIRGKESTGEVAVAERDQRDEHLRSLAKKLSFDVVEVPDGSVTLSLKGGFSIVSGANAKTLDFNHGPSFLAGASPPSLSSGVLGYIVYDYSGGSGNGHINLTDRIAAHEGRIGGLLKIRGVNDPSNTSAFQASGILSNVAQRVEGLARTLLTEFNAEYLGPDRGGTPGVWDPSSGDLNGNTPSAFGFFTVPSNAALDANANGYPDASDLTASGIDSFARILEIVPQTPEEIAAARDASGGVPAAAVFPEGDGSNIDAITLLQDRRFTFSAGGTYSFDGTLRESYHETVGTIGNYINSNRVDRAVAEANQISAELRRDEVSSVSLDEEFSKTITFQRSFEASSRLVQVTKDLFEDIVNII